MKHVAFAMVFLVAGCASVPAVNPLQAMYDLRVAEAKRIAVETGDALRHMSVADVIKATQEQVTDGLRDPSSAQFRKVRIVDHGGLPAVCGEVNGRNAYGGYAGYQPFIGSPHSYQLVGHDFTTAEGAAASAGYRTHCLLGESR